MKKEEQINKENKYLKFQITYFKIGKILPVLSNKNRLLSTLLITNAMVNCAMPITFDAIVPDYLAIIFTTGFVFVFGEMIPQALGSGTNQLKIAANLAGLVKVNFINIIIRVFYVYKPGVQYLWLFF